MSDPLNPTPADAAAQPYAPEGAGAASYAPQQDAYGASAQAQQPYAPEGVGASSAAVQPYAPEGAGTASALPQQDAFAAPGQPQQPQFVQPGTNQYAQYGQAPQGAYGQAGYAVNPALEKIRSNASTVRIASFLSFIFGGLFLSGGMWYWANKMTAEAQALGAPLDIMTDLQSARNTAKICAIIQIVFLALGMLLFIGSFILAILAGGSSY